MRNNLQLVHGMLDKQVQNTNSVEGREGISAIARRVMRLAQVYEHLLGTGMTLNDRFRRIPVVTLFELQVVTGHSASGGRATCHCDPLNLDLDTVTAMGLAVSELIANSYAQAFPDGAAGSITVSLSVNPQGDGATIVFADSGVGFTETRDSKRHGLGLMKRLIEQVGGSATLRSDHGAEWTVQFPVPRGKSAA